MLPELGLLNSPLSLSGTIVFWVGIVEHLKRLINAAISSTLFHCDLPSIDCSSALGLVKLGSHLFLPFAIRLMKAVLANATTTLLSIYGLALHSMRQLCLLVCFNDLRFLDVFSHGLCLRLLVRLQRTPALCGGAPVDCSILAPSFCFSLVRCS
jgi:hypothetical protein